MANFMEEIAPLLDSEGGLNTNKSDRGGITKFGISKKSYPNLDISRLTQDDAINIYKKDYWDAIGGDNLPPAVAAVAFDAAVNHGVGTAKKLLKNSGGDPEGMIKRRERIYTKLAQDPSQRQFYNGWMNRLSKLSGRVANMVNPIGTAYADETPYQGDDMDSLGGEYQAFLKSQPPAQRPDGMDSLGDEYKAFLQKGSGEKPGVIGQWVDKATQNAKDEVGGFIGHAGKIGATLLAPVDAAAKALGVQNDYIGRDDRREAIEGGLESMGVNPDSTRYKTTGLLTDIAGTAGAGTALAAGAKAIPVISKLAPAIESWGMSGGNIAQKAAGGAITGAASSALVDPETALAGGVVGAALPVGIRGAEKLGSGIVQGYRSLTRPAQEKIADKIVAATGKGKDEIIDLLTNQARAAELPDLLRTVPQILQDPSISQLARTVKTNSSMALGEAEAAQQNVFKQALEGIAPSGATVQDAADKAGSAISQSVQGDYKAATKAISNKFNELRNNTEKTVSLPLDKLRATVDQYLGAGTVGKGSGAKTALKVAEDLSEVKPVQGALQGIVVKEPKTAWHNQTINHEKDNLLTAITKLGGINKEKAQSTYGNRIWEDVDNGLNVFRNNGGKTLDEMAEALKEQGYLADHENLNDLVGYLYDNPRGMYSMGKQDYAGVMGEPRNAEDQLHQQLGELISALNKKNAPKAAKESAEPVARDLSGKVNFKELQNLRSSIGDLAQQAKLSGKNTENAALKQMVSDIDGHLDELANNWEGVTPVWLDKYKEARGLHKAKMERFKTGAQSGLFKPKSNGEMAVEGGEIPGKFYSSKASQSRDVQSFKRLVNNNGELVKELKEFALTKAGQTATANGNLAQGYVKWAKSHSGANKELFTSTEKAKIDAIAREISLAAKAEDLGRVTGSDTAQKLKSITDLGLVDNKFINLLANKVPMGSGVLNAIKESSGRERSNLIAELLADPEKLKAALEIKRSAKTNKFAGLTKVRPLAIPAASRLLTQQ
jgi:Glycosyl hydrolase 108